MLSYSIIVIDLNTIIITFKPEDEEETLSSEFKHNHCYF